MKLLIVGSDKIYAIENYYVKYLRQVGLNVSLFTAQSIFYDYYQKGLVNKLYYKLGISGILNNINRLFKEAVETFKPTVIWIFKGMEIYPESLRWAKSKGIRLISYNPDNPFIFTGKGSGNNNVIKSLPMYDLHFTYNFTIEKRLRDQFKVITAYLPFGFELSDELFNECVLQPEVIKVCFLGNPDKQRADFIAKLAQNGIEIDLYGTNWDNYVRHPNLSIFKSVYGNDLWKVLRRYRVQLNLMRIHNEDSHNMRSFEVPGVGGIMVAPDTTEHRFFFTDKKEVFLFSDMNDCVQIIKEILLLTPEEANKIRDKTRVRSILSGYGYKERAGYALKIMEQWYG